MGMRPKHYEFRTKATIKGIRKAMVGRQNYVQEQFSNHITLLRQGEQDDGVRITKIGKFVSGTNNKRVMVDAVGPNIPIVYGSSSKQNMVTRATGVILP